MSTLTQFTVTGKEKDDFYGFHVTGQANQVINRTITKNITGTYTNQHLYEFALGTAYDASTITFTNATSLVRLAGAEIETGGYYNLYNRTVSADSFGRSNTSANWTSRRSACSATTMAGPATPTALWRKG